MSGIRVTYSGLISLVVGALGTVTGLIFILIVTRTLSVQEFGTWGLIISLFSYVILFEPVVGLIIGVTILHIASIIIQIVYSKEKLIKIDQIKNSKIIQNKEIILVNT